jgi:hypothetical protein
MAGAKCRTIYLICLGAVIKSQSREYFRLSRRMYNKTDQIIKTNKFVFPEIYALRYVYSVTRFNNLTFFSKTTREMTLYYIKKNSK